MQPNFGYDPVRFPAILWSRPARVDPRTTPPAASGMGQHGTMAGAPVPGQHRALSDLARKEGAGRAPAAPRYGCALSGAFISIQFWQPGSWGYLGEATPVVLDFHFPSSSSF